MNVFPFIIIIVIVVMGSVSIMTIAEHKNKVKLEEMKAVNTRIEGLNNSSSEDIIQELREENASLKADLGEIKRIVSSIEKMMKEIE